MREAEVRRTTVGAVLRDVLGWYARRPIAPAGTAAFRQAGGGPSVTGASPDVRGGSGTAARVRDGAGTAARAPAPPEALIGHSADLRVLAYLLVGAELLVEGLMDAALVPPAWRPAHLLWLALLVDATLAFAAVTRRNPHRLGRGALLLRAAFGEEVAVPLAAVAAVRRERTSVPGRGVRPVPGSPEALVCTVAGTAELVLELRDPLVLRRADGTRLTARRLHLAADDPAAAHQVLRAALRAQQEDL